MSRTVRFAFLLLLSSLAAAADDYRRGGSEHVPNLEWGYRSQKSTKLRSPEQWREVAPGCGNGKHQSPIDIRFAERETLVDGKLSVPRFFYAKTPMEVFHNRHTIQATDRSEQNRLEYQGETYRLRNIHYHIKSEHLLDGEQFDLEVHMVHESAKGELLVLGVLVDILGKTSPYGQGLLEMIRSVKGHKSEYDPVKIAIDPARFLPVGKAFAAYRGSLTTPPCSESVRWLVFLEPQTLAPEVREQFAGKKLAVGFHNFRPHFNAGAEHELRFSQR